MRVSYLPGKFTFSPLRHCQVDIFYAVWPTNDLFQSPKMGLIVKNTMQIPFIILFNKEMGPA